MADDPALSFAIDSSQAQRAIGVLETLKATSVGLVQTNQNLATSNQNLTQIYGQERDRLQSLAETTSLYGGTLGGLVDKLNAVRPGITSTTAALEGYTQVLRQAVAATTQMNAGVDGLDRYATKARDLRLQTQDLATGLDRITAALQNQTIAGHETALTLGRLGISVEGIASNRPDVVLQQLADRIRGFRDTQLRLAAVQEVLGPTADAGTVQALERQPYVPVAEQQRRERNASAQAEVDATQVQVQRRATELERNEARRQDLVSQYSLTSGVSGGLTDPFRRAFTSRNEQREELERISRLPSDQRRPFENTGFTLSNWINQVGQNAPTTPNLLPGADTPYATYRAQAEAARNGSQGTQTPRAVTGLAYAIGGINPVLGNLFSQAAPAIPQAVTAVRNIANGTYSSRQQEIAQRSAEEAEDSRFGALGALPNRIGRTVSNAVGLYRPLLQQDDRPLSPYEQRILNQQSAGILSQAGDPTLQGIVAAQEAQSVFETPEIRQRYVRSFGAEEGNRRFDLGSLIRQQQTGYATNPENRVNDQAQRDQEQLRVPLEERARARFQQQFAEQLGSPFIAGQASTSFQRLSRGEQAAGQNQFEQQQAATAQGRTEDTTAQITFQKNLATALADGRAAAENYTRAYQAFRQAQLEGAGDTRAGAQALDALNIAMAQRITQGTALVTQMERETAANQKQLDLTRDSVTADPGTRAAAALRAGIEGDRQKLIDEGQLPNPAGGTYRYFNRETGQTETRHADAPEAQGIIDRYTQSRRTAIGQQGETGIRAVESNSADQVRNARALADIVRDQGVSLERASEILQTQNALRDAAAKLAEGSAKYTLEELDTQREIVEKLKEKTAEEQRQAAIASDNARNLSSARETETRARLQDIINRARPEDRPTLRAQLEPTLRSIDARQGGAAATPQQPGLVPVAPPTSSAPPLTSGAPPAAPAGPVSGNLAHGDIAATDLSDAAKGVLRMIYGGEQGPGGYATGRNYIGADGRGQQIPETHQRAARLAGRDPGDKTPEAQDHENWELAKSDYRANTGRDLEADASAAIAGDQTAAQRITGGLRTTWTSLPGGREPNGATRSAYARLSPNLAGLTPELRGADRGAIDQNDTAIAHGVRSQQEEADVARDEASRARLAAERRQRALAGNPAEQGLAGITPSDPSAPSDLQARDVARQRAQQESANALAQANTAAATTQNTEALTRQIAALKEGGQALAEVNRQLQVERETRERGASAVDKETRMLQLQNEQLLQQTKALGERHQSSQDSIEQQKAVNDLGVFSTPGQEQATREITAARQRQSRDGTAGSSAGNQEIDDIKARQSLAEQTNEIQQMKQAAAGTGQAVEGFLDSVIVHGEKARSALKTLGGALEEIALKAFVVQPLERLANNLFSDLFGGDSSSGNGGNGGGRGGGGSLVSSVGGGLLGSLFGRAENSLLGGGGGGSNGASGSTQQSPGLLDRVFSGIGSLFSGGGGSTAQPAPAQAAPAQAAPSGGGFFDRIASGIGSLFGGSSATPAQASAPIDMSRSFQSQPQQLTTGYTVSETSAATPAAPPIGDSGSGQTSAGVSSPSPGSGSSGSLYDRATAGGGAFIGTTDTSAPPGRPGRVSLPTDPTAQAVGATIQGTEGLAAKYASSALEKSLRGTDAGSTDQPNRDSGSGASRSSGQSGGLVGALIDKIGGKGFYEGGGLIGKLWKGSSLQKSWQNSSIGQFFGAGQGQGEPAGDFGGPLTSGDGFSDADLVTSAPGSPGASGGVEAGNFDSGLFDAVGGGADAAVDAGADAAVSAGVDAGVEAGAWDAVEAGTLAFAKGGIFDSGQPSAYFATGGKVAAMKSQVSRGDGSRMTTPGSAPQGTSQAASVLAGVTSGYGGGAPQGRGDPSALMQAILRPNRYAKGDVFAGESFPPVRFGMGQDFAPADNLPPLQAFEHQIVDRPVNFRFAGGAQIGQMGEAGPEAILPLQRGPDGRLGVAAGGGGGGGTTSVVMNISTPDANSFHSSRSQVEAKTTAAFNRAMQRNSY